MPKPPPLSQSWLSAEPGGQSGHAVWHVDLEGLPPVGGNAPCWLSSDEQERAARFLRHADRERFVRGHQALRYVLGAYLGRAPEALRFRAGPQGKPELDGSDRDRLPFNLSHSGRHVLIGIGEWAIGVDVEAYRPIGDPLAIARAHFHPGEIADLTCLPGSERIGAFFRCWTRKEAVVKALGLGLSLALDRFRVALPPFEASVLRWEQADPSERGWSLQDLDLGPDAVGAVAIPQAGAPCARYRLPPTWADTA